MKILTSQISAILLASIALLAPLAITAFAPILIVAAAHAQVRDPGTTPTNLTPPGTNEILPVSATSSINQQAGVIQNNGLGSYGSLNYPSCSGVCVFAIGRTTRIGNADPSAEAVVGAVWQINSPETTQAQNARILAETQRGSLNNQTTLALVEKLAEAIETNKPERANAIAIILAPRLGYGDYRQLLKDIHKGNSTATSHDSR
jgi:hypothetical protein